MPTPAKQPDPELVAHILSIVASISTCKCSYSRVTVATALRSLLASYIFTSCSYINAKMKDPVLALISIEMCVGLWDYILRFISYLVIMRLCFSTHLTE